MKALAAFSVARAVDSNNTNMERSKLIQVGVGAKTSPDHDGLSVSTEAVRKSSPQISLSLSKNGTVTWALLVMAFLALVRPVASEAAIRYVDSSVSVSGNGQSWATAWKQISNISGVAGGDTVYISGGPSGSSQTYTFSQSWAPTIGTPGNPITYKIGQDSAHNGTAFFSGPAVTFLAPGVDDIVISGDAGDGQMHFSIANPATGVSPWSSLFVTTQDAQRVRISYLNCGYLGTSGVTEIVFLYNAGIRNIELDHLFIKANGWTTLDGVFKFYNVAAGLGYDQGVFIHDCEIWTPYVPRSGSGSDCVQTGGSASGITLSNNVFIGWDGGGSGHNGSSAQHTDGFQIVGGNYIKVVNNYYFNMVNLVYTGFAGSHTFSHHIIANNVWMDGGWGDARYAIEYLAESGAYTLEDIEVSNNTLYHNPGSPSILFKNAGTGLTVNNVRVRNNIYNSSLYLSPTVGAITQVGNMQMTDAQMTAAFVNFQKNNTNGNFKLKAGSTPIGAGANLSSVFAYDKTGVARPASGGWDIGAYQYGGAVSSPVAQLSTSTIDFGSVRVGSNATATITIKNAGVGTLAGSASVSAPFSIVSGGTYSLGSDQAQTVTLRYSPTASGSSSQTVTFTGGGGASALAVGSAWMTLSGLSFPSSAGTVTAPFVVSGSSVSQSSQTGVADGGKAVYGFTIAQAGNYMISADVSAPSAEANSFYVNIDSTPTEQMVWDIPIASGLVTQNVTWRGNGVEDATSPSGFGAEFSPQVFNLSAGTHQLIIVGREAGAALGTITIAPYARPNPPQNLRVVTTNP